MYLYLTELTWSAPWVQGGRIPINPASTYRAMERAGIYTPDENLIYDAPYDVITAAKGYIEFTDTCRNSTVRNNRLDGRLLPDAELFNHYTDDGLILSFCTVRDAKVCHRLKKKACVEIADINRLRSLIDEQIGVASEARECEYTAGHQRNHFLKSDEDSWQQEFRLFWKAEPKRVWVTLPPGVGRSIKMPKWVRRQS